MVHHVPRYLAHGWVPASRGGATTKRVALLVMDGLALSQWTLLRTQLAGRKHRVGEHALFAWVPTFSNLSLAAVDFCRRATVLFLHKPRHYAQGRGTLATFLGGPRRKSRRGRIYLPEETGARRASHRTCEGGGLASPMSRPRRCRWDCRPNDAWSADGRGRISRSSSPLERDRRLSSSSLKRCSCSATK